MAILKAVNSNRYTLEGVIRYITDVAAHDGKIVFYGTSGILDQYDPIREMMLFKWAYGKMGGLQYRQIILSFTKTETQNLPSEFFVRPVSAIATMLTENLGLQVVFAIHGNTENIHAHYILNSVSNDGSKLQINKRLLFLLKQEINNILRDYGLGIILMHDYDVA